jgi:hypothetical protein
MDETWRAFDDARFELRFRYPDPTPRGQRVQKIDVDLGTALLVHHRTEDRELYVELRRYPPQSAREEYDRHRPELEVRFGDGAVSALTETALAGRPAHTYAFRWPEGERVAIVASSDSWTYRVIYNSASPLNPQVLATFEWR